MTDEEASDGGPEDLEISNNSFSIQKICPIICNKSNTFEFLVEAGALKSSQRCSNSHCRRDIKIIQDKNRRDAAIWNCSNCRT